MIALDASALLAFLFQEKGADQVAAALREACISTVNVSEVAGRFARDGHNPEEFIRQLHATHIDIVPFSLADATRAAALLPLTQPLGLSLGDRACLALAKARGIPALTADRAWLKLKIGVTVHCIR